MWVQNIEMSRRIMKSVSLVRIEYENFYVECDQNKARSKKYARILCTRTSVVWILEGGCYTALRWPYGYI